MTSTDLPSLDSAPALIVVATAPEAAAALRGWGLAEPPPGAWRPLRLPSREGAFAAGAWLVVSGVGKCNAAGATAFALTDIKPRCAWALNIGVAGALPRSGSADGSRARLGQCVIATASVFADEGLAAPDGFTDVAAMGFPPLDTRDGSDAPASAGAPRGSAGMAAPSDTRLVELLASSADARGPIATVSTCSGTDALARAVAQRTGAIAEAMEGAAVGLVSARLGVPFAELRTISNSTGDRPSQVWDIRGALERLERAVASLTRREAR